MRMKRGIGRAVVMALLAAVLSGTAAAYVFTDPRGKFTATFPAEPVLEQRQAVSDAGIPLIYFTWEVNVDGRDFAVIVAEHAWAPVKNYDKNVGSVVKKGLNLLRHTAITVDGVEGREIFGNFEGDNKVMRQRIFQVDRWLYQIVYWGPFGTESRADVRTFMESFRLTK